MSKVQKLFRFTEEMDQKIKRYAQHLHVSQSQFMAMTVDYFIKNEGAEYVGFYEAMGKMFEDYQKEITNELKKIKLGVNQISKESQMQIEFWNNQYLEKGTGNLLTSDVKKSNEVSLAEANIQNRILKMQQKKYS